MFAHSQLGKGDACRMSTQSDSAEGSTELAARRMLRLARQGKHRNGKKSDVYDCLRQFATFCDNFLFENKVRNPSVKNGRVYDCRLLYTQQP